MITLKTFLKILHARFCVITDAYQNAIIFSHQEFFSKDFQIREKIFKMTKDYKMMTLHWHWVIEKIRCPCCSQTAHNPWICLSLRLTQFFGLNALKIPLFWNVGKKNSWNYAGESNYCEFTKFFCSLFFANNPLFSKVQMKTYVF